MKLLSLVFILLFTLFPFVSGYILNGKATPNEIEIGTSSTITVDISAPFTGTRDDIRFSTTGIQIDTLSSEGNNLVLGLTVLDEAKPGDVTIYIDNTPWGGDCCILSNAFSLIIKDEKPPETDISITESLKDKDSGKRELDIYYNPNTNTLSIALYNDNGVDFLLEDKVYAPIEEGLWGKLYSSDLDLLGKTQGDSISYSIGDLSYSYTIPIKKTHEIAIPDTGLLHRTTIKEEETDDFISALFNFLYFLLFGIIGEPVGLGQVTVEGTTYSRFNTTIPNNTHVYFNNVNDYHIFFEGKVKNCKIKSPPGPPGWSCKVTGKNSNIVKFYNEKGQPLSSNDVIDGMDIELDPPNAKVLDWWITGTQSSQLSTVSGAVSVVDSDVRLTNGRNWPTVIFQDCANYCPPKTDAQFQADIQQMIWVICQKFKNALGALEEIDRLQLGAEPKPVEVRRLKDIKNNKIQLKKILEKTVKKCLNGITIECDTSWNPQCYSGENKAFVPTPFDMEAFNNDIHLCPTFCKDPNQASTLLHESTHFGDSTDDVGTDPMNAHELETIVPWLNDIYTRSTSGYQ